MQENLEYKVLVHKFWEILIPSHFFFLVGLQSLSLLSLQVI